MTHETTHTVTHDVTIRLLGADDWAAFQALRVQATEEAPLAIWPTRAEEAARAPAEVRARIAPTPHQAVLGAFAGDALVAIAGLRREPLAQVAHRAMLWGVYVHPAQRRGGLARRLLAAACAHARALGALQVHLAVNAANDRALTLYETLGFIPYGREPRTLRVDNVFYDEILMVLALDGDRAGAIAVA
jgi:ribosomal protein S18 acetylase RimI-like enzyme